MNTHKEFVPHQPSLDMKELGFDEPCVYYVDKNNESYIYNFETHPDEFIEWCGVNVIPTPTFSQAFRWFREKYKLFCWIEKFHVDETYIFQIPPANFTKIQGHYKTYEEAELACLIKLIEIVKTK